MMVQRETGPTSQPKSMAASSSQDWVVLRERYLYPISGLGYVSDLNIWDPKLPSGERVDRHGDTSVVVMSTCPFVVDPFIHCRRRLLAPCQRSSNEIRNPRRPC
jgi:hypothetical protein